MRLRLREMNKNNNIFIFVKIIDCLKSFRSILLIILFLNTTLCYADYLTPTSIVNLVQHHWYINFAAAAGWPTKSSDYKTPSPATIKGTDNYSYQKSSARAVFSLGGGYEWQRNTQFWLPNYSLGLRYSYYAANKGTGIYNFANYYSRTDFTYKTQSQALLAVGKLAILDWHNIVPYVIGGVGFAFNRFSDYQDAPDMASKTGLPKHYHTFTNKSSMSFTYLVGLGLDYQINRNWQLGLEYYYANLGKIKSGENMDKKTIIVASKEQSFGLTISYYFA